ACAVVIEIMGAAYPHLADRRGEILAGVEAEERKFSRTLEAGSERLAQLVEAAGRGGSIAGADAFRLHDTFGFPIDLTVEIAGDSGVGVDREGFEAAMREQRERSRATRKSALPVVDELAKLQSEFIG